MTEPRKPLSPDELVRLQQRVLANEEVSDEELRHALESLALSRAGSGTPSAPAPAVKLSSGLAERLAAARAKQSPTAQ